MRQDFRKSPYRASQPLRQGFEKWVMKMIHMVINAVGMRKCDYSIPRWHLHGYWRMYYNPTTLVWEKKEDDDMHE